MACLFGARLAPVVDQVAMLGTWVEGVRVLREEGIRFVQGEAETRLAVRALDKPDGVQTDLVLVLVKSHQTARAAAWAAQILRPGGLALTLQNGLGNLEQLVAVVGPQRSALGVSMQGATLLGPGHVRHGGDGPTVLATTPATEARLQELATLLRQAGFETSLVDDARALVWGKLVVNAAINALTAILRVPNGALAEQEDARELMSEAARETAAVAQALGIALPYADPAGRAVEVARKTAVNRSSMLQDVLRGTPTEIEAINGAVVELGRQLGLPTPVNETLLRLVRVGSRKYGVGSMETVTTIADVRRIRARRAGTWGLVPTMGYLHEGHLSLCQRARAECEHVAASIFVNPTQFGPHEDLARYPRDLPRDLRLLEEAGVELVFTPEPDELYPAGFQTYVNVEQVTLPLEGAARPGHFRGVATVVAKLFNIFQPERAYFGQKDAQQVAVIKQMACDLDFPVEIVVCPTVREPDGLAMSSRNSYLTPAQRQAAVVLYRSLCAAKAAWEAGERDGEALRRAIRDVLASELLASPEYVSAADPLTLAELGAPSRGVLLSMAVRVGSTRLIDNFLLEE
ncbi:MAG: pantoate--beta-alanine ligase [Thermoflexales bacterium]|nr:pantoate--beta-alanine ligase [Thermoflexales bacterium]